MTKRGKWLAGTTLALLVSAWLTTQLLLTRSGVLAMHKDELQWRHRMRLVHPDAVFSPVQPVHLRYALLLAVASLVALIACAAVASVLIVGGRRLWAFLLLAAVPLSYFIGRGDANPLGLGWGMRLHGTQTWLDAGAVIDSVVVVALTGLLLALLPRRTAVVPLAPAVLRTLPIAVVAFGYWLIGNPLPDTHARFFVTRALLLILAAAVIATTRLPLVVRALTLFVVPFADPTMADGLIQGYGTWGTYLNHVLVAAATGAYVLAVPFLTQLQARNRAGSASSAAMSAMN